MPVSTDSGEQPPAKRCKYCDESTHSVDGSGLFILKLDQDLIETIEGNFPEWNLASGSDNNNNKNGNNTDKNNNNNNNSSNNNTNHHHHSLVSNGLKRKENGTRLAADKKKMAEGEHSKTSSAAPALVRMTVNSGAGPDSDDQRQSPPKAIVDSSPLQPQMDKNKESLKVKLALRRSVNQLVEQGIMPPLKPSPALHEQRKQLERAKTGDLLKAKIQQRPHRQELERRHILEQQEGHIDPSLAEKRRMLEKKFLADQLNSKISHRPGPLELIEKNILHTEEPIEHMVKQGLVTFKAAAEGTQKGPPHPSSYVTYEDDSQSSEDHSQQSPIRPEHEVPATGNLVFTIPTTGGAVVLASQIRPPALVPTSIVAEIPPPPPLPKEQTTQNLYAQLCQNTVSSSPTLVPLVSAPSPCSLGSSTSSLSPLSSVSSPPSQILTRTVPSPLIQHSNQPKSDAPGKDKNRKKSKAKPAAKVRAIKFHEYKGPPNAAQKSSATALQSGETNYQLIMRQQSLLEYLETIYKQTPILPASQKPSNPPPLQQIQPEPSLCSSIPPSPASTYSDSTNSGDLSRLGKMKVSDLKLQLKKLNLPVSGPKPKLIERLKHHHIEAGTEESIEDFDADSPRHSMSPESEIDDSKSEISYKMSFTPKPVEMCKEIKMEIKEEIEPCMQMVIDDDIVREQQRQIDELQRKLKESQAQIELMKQQKNSEPIAVRLKHQLEAKMQKEKLAQLEQQQKLQREHLAFQQAKNQANALYLKQQQQQQQQQQHQAQPTTINAFITPTKKESTATTVPVTANGLFTFYENTGNQIQLATGNANGIPTLFVVGLSDKKGQTHHRTASMPSIVVPLSSGPPPLVESSQPMTLQQQQQLQNPPPIKHQIPLPRSSPPELRPIDPIPPPQYEEATKQLENSKKQLQQKINGKAKAAPSPKTLCNNIANAAVKTVTKSVPMSQDMTDVLEILIKNGDLPESAVNPAIPNGHLMINPNLIFDNRRHVQEVNQQQSAPYSSEIPSALLLDSTPDTLNMASVMSPMHQDADTLDKLLGQAQTTSSADIHTPHNSPVHAVSPPTTDFMDFMEFQMDIEDDSCHAYAGLNNNVAPMAPTKGRDMNPSLTPSLNELIMQQQQQHQQHTHTNGLTNGFQFGGGDGLNNNTNASNQSTNGFTDTPMDFENLLPNFDIPSNLTDTPDHNHHHHHQHQQYNNHHHPHPHHHNHHHHHSLSTPPTHHSLHHDNLLELFNEEFRMGMSGDPMSCEVDNLLCNI